MKPFPVSMYLSYVRSFQDSAFGASENSNADIEAVEKFATEAEEYSLLSVADQFRRIANTISRGSSPSEIKLLFQELMNRLEDDCDRHVVMMIEPDHVKYVENSQFFDPIDPSQNKVSVQFPSAAEDIAESGKCLGCGRATACVMHLLRVMESGLKALAKDVGVGPQNDWGKYLDGINKELQHRLAASGARTPDERFYSEAHVTFDGVRRAWRNPTMHVDKTYTVEHAEEILIATRSFMRHLATRIQD
jgi:hypothetical protein